MALSSFTVHAVGSSLSPRNCVCILICFPNYILQGNIIAAWIMFPGDVVGGAEFESHTGIVGRWAVCTVRPQSTRL